jgi:hypothetical protein
MRLALIPLAALTLLASACGGSSDHTIASHGVRVVAPAGWSSIRPAQGLVTDPRTLLVAGTAGVRARPSRCSGQSYGVPRSAAAVVVVGWSSVAAAGAAPPPGRAPLGRLVSVHRPFFECFAGRGAGADLLLAGKRYQVRVLVGDGASKERVRQALEVARSFEPAG